ncbi:MAG: sulfotransferase family 2 domain-containing protein [Acidobacteria bacterium]|nr:sulfotransferase family 2 domain-containing protein [Acidobacteriota bacterium]
MIITPDFVFIHYPKTGGTFVTHVLSRLYGDQLVNVDKHGTCSDIPEEHRGKPLLSTVRSPYDRYVSQYRFGWWVMHPEDYCGAEAMRELYPHYPDITFEEFLCLANTLFLNCHRSAPTGFVNDIFQEERRLGWHTENFVRFYCRNPRQTYARLDEPAIERAGFVQDMFDVHFLRTARLRQGLHDFLLGFGHRPEDLAFILSSERVLPDMGGRRPEGDRWESYYTPELKDFVRTRERLIFRLFPEFET